jgi:hypothetical protein
MISSPESISQPIWSNYSLLKGLELNELKNSDPLLDITFCKALHVIAYKQREVTLLKFKNIFFQKTHFLFFDMF